MTDYGEYLQPSRGLSLVRPTADDIPHSLKRNSYYSHNTPSVSASTQSWVYSTQQNPPGPPPPPRPLPIPLPTPVQRLRPLALPNPHPQPHHSAALHAVNPSEPLDHEDEVRMDIIATTPDAAYRKAGPSKVRSPGTSIPSPLNNTKDKKRTGVKGLVKSIRRIPRIMFGYGASKSPTTTLRHRVVLDSDGEGTPTSFTTRTGNTLPKYVSNPPTPIAGPIQPNIHHYVTQPMRIQPPITVPVSESPPPEVVRLDDVRRHRPSFRIMPPSVNIARSETAHFFPGPNATTRSSQYTDNPTDSSASAAGINTTDRTTVMLYNHDGHTPTPNPTPPLPLSRQISSSGPPGRLSYVGSEQIVRPTSFHGGSQAPPPIEIPSSIPRMATPASHLSYVSEVKTIPSTLPLNIIRSSSQPRSQLSNQPHPHQPTSPPQHQPSFALPVIESSEPTQSPVSAHPQPTTDYLKMALSPPHSITALAHHEPITNLPSSSRVTSFSYDPSFTNMSTPIERFFKTLYNMPWIAYGRNTVDYFPGKVGHVHGHTVGRRKSGKGVRDGKERKGEGEKRRRTKDMKGKARDSGRDRRSRSERKGRGRRRRDNHDDGKPVSWYKSVLSHSRRASAELDLLTSDLGSLSSPTTITSLEAAIGLGLQNLPVDAASPRLAAAAAVAATTTAENSAERARRQRERKENVGGKQERTSHSHHHRQADPSPLIPAVYPFHYPPYPFTYPYTAFNMPPPPIVSAHSQPQSQQPPEHPQGPRSNANRQDKQGQHQSQPLLYSPGIPHPGYTTAAHVYQPMIAPQVYLLHSTSHGQLQAITQKQPSGHVDNGSAVHVDGAGTGDSGQQQVLEQ